MDEVLARYSALIDCATQELLLAQVYLWLGNHAQVNRCHLVVDSLIEAAAELEKELGIN